MPAVSDQIRSLYDARPDARLKQLEVPVLMPFHIQLRRSLARETVSHTLFQQFIRLILSTGCQRIPAFLVFLIFLGVPVATPNTLQQALRNLIALYR